MLSEDFIYLVEEFGRPKNAISLSSEELSRYGGVLPDGLIEFWRECGLGTWLEGRFQFCNPGKYQSIVDTLLNGDADYKPDRTFIYGFTAFGELYLWNQDFQFLAINLPRLWASGAATEAGWAPAPADIAVTAALVMLDQEGAADWREDSDKAPLMFQKVRGALGEVALGECYGFVPALKLGGLAKVETVRRMSALEHFSILAQLGPVELFDYSDMSQKFVRHLGG